MSVIFDLGVTKFFSLTYEEQLAVTQCGRPTPIMDIECTIRSRGTLYRRQFDANIYSRNRWICGCELKNAFYCFPCALFSDDRGEKIWTETGVSNLIRLPEKIRKHENSRSHISNMLRLAFFSTNDKKNSLGFADVNAFRRYNEEVVKNRFVLSNVIDALKLSAGFDASFRACGESGPWESSGVFLELLEFSSKFDKTLFENEVVFKYVFDTLRNDILDCILHVCRDEIVREIHEAPVLAAMSHEVSDVSSTFRAATVFRYVTKDGVLVERFWGFLRPTELEDTAINDALRGDDGGKLIAVSYGGGVIGSVGDLRKQLRLKYANAHFVRCYAHRLNAVLSRACAVNRPVRQFFGNVQEVCDFFSKPRRVAVLDGIVKKKTGRCLPAEWDIRVRTVNVVYEYRDCIVECAEQLESIDLGSDAARGIRCILSDESFIRWLNFFRYAMPHVDILYRQLEKELHDPAEEEIITRGFEHNINRVFDMIDDIVQESSNLVTALGETTKRKRVDYDEFQHRAACMQVCDVLLTDVKERFAYTDHLVAESLLLSENFIAYHNKFPVKSLDLVCSSYNMLNWQRLKTELVALYSNKDFREFRGMASLFKFVLSNNFEDTLVETKKLLEILLTTPMATSEPERRFFTLRRIGEFLRHSTCRDRSTAVAMLWIERKFVTGILNFNDKVIDKFKALKGVSVPLALKEIH